MPNELPDYLIGDKGVQLTGSPIHTPDSGLLVGQNVEFVREQGLGGIASRRSLTRLNGSVLAGTLQHVANLPFPFPTSKVLMVGLNTGESGLSWLSSTDGTTYATVADTIAHRCVNVAKFSADVSVSLHAGNFYMPQRSGSYRRRFYFASDNYVVWFVGIVATPTRPPVDHYDGSVGLELFRLPDNPTATLGSFPYWIIGMWVIDGLIWMVIFDPGGVAPDHKGRVMTFDPENGTIALVGNRFGNGTNENTKGMPYALASFAGRIFVGTMGISGNPAGGVYSILPTVETTWTLDRAIAVDDGYVMDLLVFQGNLYMATNSDASGTPRVDQRTPNGTWSVSFTGPAAGVSYCGGLVEFNSLLFVVYFKSGASCLIKKFDGTSWTTDKDVGVDYAVLAHAPGTPLVFEGNLYWPFYDSTNGTATTGFLLKRTTAGVWSKVLNARGIRGGLGFYRPDAS
jgi:hypothetical protein